MGGKFLVIIIQPKNTNGCNAKFQMELSLKEKKIYIYIALGVVHGLRLAFAIMYVRMYGFKRMYTKIEKAIY